MSYGKKLKFTMNVKINNNINNNTHHNERIK